VARAKELWRDQYSELPVSEQPEHVEEEVELSSIELWQIKMYGKQRSHGSRVQDKFDRFIDAAPLDVKGSLLDWWQAPAQREAYPQLHRMAIDVLTACAMSAESERVFSGARRTIAWSRMALSARMIEVLECLKHWIRTGVVDDIFGAVSTEDSASGDADDEANSDIDVDSLQI
jgi:hypothetical protein